jgi:cardiolipin synthase A/B
MKISYLIRSCLFFLVTLSGCATLPGAHEFIYGPLDFRYPTIVGSRGELSPEQSKRIIQRLKKQSGSTDLLTRQSIVLEEISGSPLSAGNKAKLLINGPATYAAMEKAIQKATDHINFETFIFEDDEIGRHFADLLIKEQEKGVQVNLIYDSIGSINTPRAFFKRLSDSGIKVLEFNPIDPLKAKKIDFLTHRDHRKILIVDGKIAFTGGVNVSAVYSSIPSSRAPGGLPWRDTDVQIEGPAVAEFQKLFLDTWKWQKGPELAPRNYFPELRPQGNELIQVIGNRPGKKNRVTYIMYVSAISFAEKNIHLTNAYFVPDGQTMAALSEAAKRGLDVKLVVPGTSDSQLVFYAGRSHYEDLLESGVKLYERRGGMLHAKTAVIDGVWSTIGSTNLDLWSFARDNEVNAVILGRDFSKEMEALFTADIEASHEIRLEEWRNRPLASRFKEWISRLLSYWL